VNPECSTASPEAVDEFAERLLVWFDRHGRKDLPWQQSITPYRGWVSEVMLQQTQVATVIPYYERFMGAFPDVAALADASLDDVLAHWSGLGYYARGRNLHKAAVLVRDEHHGRFPKDFDAVVALPGIGRSTAGAILAIACGQRFAILDGNVKRVLARYHAIDGWPGKSATLKRLWAAAESHTPTERIADYTQAIMDLGATVCTRSRPACTQCPLEADCKAHAQSNENAYPGKKPKRIKPLRSVAMLLVHDDKDIYLERRPASGIWGGLWSLPELDDAQALEAWYRSSFGLLSPAAINVSSDYVVRLPILRHSFSHYDLDIEPIEVRLRVNADTPTSATSAHHVADSADRLWHPLNQLEELGLPAPVRTLIGQLPIAGNES